MSQNSEVDDLNALRAFVVDCPELRQLEQIVGRFNVFEVLKLHDHEIRHSNVLAWLLDPAESHGFGDLFLRRWLMRVFHDVEFETFGAPDPIDIDATQFQLVSVRREWENIDLLLEIGLRDGTRWAIAIENKIWSAQHSNQLTRYRQILEKAAPDARRCHVLLTVQPVSPEDSSFAPASYAQIADVLDACLAENAGVIADGPRLMVEHYQQLIRSRFMANSEVEELARKIYAAHPKALDLLFEYRPDNLAGLTAVVGTEMKKAAKKYGLKPLAQNKGAVRFIPIVWDIEKNNESENWSTIFCELHLAGRKPVFKAVAGEWCPQEVREKIFAKSKKGGYPNTVNKTKIPAQWFSFFGVKGSELKLEDATSEDIQEIGEKVWKWCEAQIKSTPFAKMVKDVVPLLAELPEDGE